MTIDYRKRPRPDAVPAPRVDYRKRPVPGREVPPSGARTAAISLEKVAGRAPGLVSLYKSAAVSLAKHEAGGQRAAVYLVLDRSGSMRPFYRDGTVQHLAERTLALAAHLDDDGVVPVFFFSTDIDGTAEISLDAYRDRITPLHESMGHMGRTNYHVAMQAVIDHYLACGAQDPALVIFQTDGGPTSKAAAEHVLCTAARLPIFWQFIGFGHDEFRFLRRLDDLPVPARRVVDNAGFFAAGPAPRTLSDAHLYDQLLQEFPQWLSTARARGIVTA
ncbi:vWA domain-containing protein [Streptomyces sp. NPDC007088]|uniref:vWA domain-containing protein n=1 Tax=Streptomyces sp. NPDC007088 TaxID=3364773 RepID=UPI0036B72047